MAAEIFPRAIIAFAIAGVGIGLYGLTNRIFLKRASKKNYRGLTNFQYGIPAILYFTTPTCAPCKTLQRPAIESVKKSFGCNLQIIEIDANARPELADYWGVLSVPTTFIIDKKGEPMHINHGVTLADKLRKQLKKVI